MGEKKDMKYLAIGDGLCAGKGTSLFTPSFVYQHARMSEEVLSERIPVMTRAHSSYRSNDILELLDEEDNIREIKESQIIVLSAGHNDFLDAFERNENENDEDFYQAYRKSKSNLDDIINKICKVKKEENDNYMLAIIGPHNSFEHHDQAEKWINKYNNYIQCRAHSPCVYSVNLDHHFKDQIENWCTRDRHYPNYLGHVEIAKKLHEYGYEHLKKEA
jgi:lysophospholipase L1-like esterase